MKEHDLVLKLRRECSKWGMCGCDSNINHHAEIASVLRSENILIERLAKLAGIKIGIDK